MKVCSKCGIEKNVTEFYKSTRYKSGYNCACKECERLRFKKNSLKYKKRKAKYYKEWIKKNKEVKKIKDKEYVSKNLDKTKAKQKRWISKLSDSYIKSILKNQGFSDEQVKELPVLIPKKKIDVLVYRNNKFQKQLKNKNHE